MESATAAPRKTTGFKVIPDLQSEYKSCPPFPLDLQSHPAHMQRLSFLGLSYLVYSVGTTKCPRKRGKKVGEEGGRRVQDTTFLEI